MSNISVQGGVKVKSFNEKVVQLFYKVKTSGPCDSRKRQRSEGDVETEPLFQHFFFSKSCSFHKLSEKVGGYVGSLGQNFLGQAPEAALCALFSKRV